MSIDLAQVLADNDGVVPVDTALQLLTELRSKNDSMKSLLDSDLETLSEVMDFLPFDAGDPLITKGESATWLGYIAMGGVDVIIGGNTVATMPPGKLLGGMGLFFGGKKKEEECRFYCGNRILYTVTHFFLVILNIFIIFTIFNISSRHTDRGLRRCQKWWGHCRHYI